MENFNWKAISIILVLLVCAIFFQGVIEFLTLVVTNFVETVVDIIRGGLSGRGGIEAVVRFCLTIIVIFGLVRLFRK